MGCGCGGSVWGREQRGLQSIRGWWSSMACGSRLCSVCRRLSLDGEITLIGIKRHLRLVKSNGVKVQCAWCSGRKPFATSSALCRCPLLFRLNSHYEPAAVFSSKRPKAASQDDSVTFLISQSLAQSKQWRQAGERFMPNVCNVNSHRAYAAKQLGCKLFPRLFAVQVRSQAPDMAYGSVQPTLC